MHFIYIEQGLVGLCKFLPAVELKLELGHILSADIDIENGHIDI